MQLLEPQPLLQEAGCGAVMAEEWGVEDLVEVGLISVALPVLAAATGHRAEKSLKISHVSGTAVSTVCVITFLFFWLTQQLVGFLLPAL